MALACHCIAAGQVDGRQARLGGHGTGQAGRDSRAGSPFTCDVRHTAGADLVGLKAYGRDIGQVILPYSALLHINPGKLFCVSEGQQRLRCTCTVIGTAPRAGTQ